MSYVKYIADVQHYNEVLSKVASVKKSLWIGTADIKDLHVKVGNSSEPFLASSQNCSKGEWKSGSYTQRNRDRSSARNSTDTRFFLSV